jgi:hypothetical protein
MRYTSIKNDETQLRLQVKGLLLIILLFGLFSPPALAASRDTLGIFGQWGAFRDASPRRCFAIAEPVARGAGGDWRPFASIASWPGNAVRGQIHIRLRRARAAGSPVMLTIGQQRFQLAAGRADAWAADAKMDAAIIAAMRSQAAMSIEARDERGRAYADGYRLKGAATAIDAAALGCAR